MNSGSPKRTRMSVERRREQLLDVTKTIAIEHGFPGVTIESIARAAGVTRPVVYTCFGDLTTLLAALVERESDRALGQLIPSLPRPGTSGTPEEQLLAAFDAYLRAGEADPETWRFVLIPPDGAPELLREAIERGRDVVVGYLAEAFKSELDEEAIPYPDEAARLVAAAADQAVRLMITQPKKYKRERFMATAAALLERLAPA